MCLDVDLETTERMRKEWMSQGGKPRAYRRKYELNVYNDGSIQLRSPYFSYGKGSTITGPGEVTSSRRSAALTRRERTGAWPEIDKGIHTVERTSLRDRRVYTVGDSICLPVTAKLEDFVACNYYRSVHVFHRVTVTSAVWKKVVAIVKKRHPNVGVVRSHDIK